MSIATFAAGCFWGMEAKFRQLQGIIDTRVGYTGGDSVNPDYKSVCTGVTGHAEAVEITFDPEKISYVDLLDFFWTIHDPTTLNRQGPDVGSQYRSAIFYHDEEQHALALKSKQTQQQRGVFNVPIVTEIMPASVFYPAEDYHQRYLEKQGRGFCH